MLRRGSDLCTSTSCELLVVHSSLKLIRCWEEIKEDGLLSCFTRYKIHLCDRWTVERTSRRNRRLAIQAWGEVIGSWEVTSLDILRVVRCFTERRRSRRPESSRLCLPCQSTVCRPILEYRRHCRILQHLAAHLFAFALVLHRSRCQATLSSNGRPKH